MSEETTRILNIEVNASDAINQMAAYTAELEKVKQQEAQLVAEKKKLQEAMKNGSVDTAAAAKQLESYNVEIAKTKEQAKAYGKEISSLSREIQNQLTIDREQTTENGKKNQSIVQLRAELANLTKEYDNLTRTERESIGGEELKKHINEITNEIKGVEEGTQRYQRNVGNYENAIKNVLGVNEKLASSLKGGIKDAAKAATESVKNLGAAAKANPLLAIVTLLVAVFGKFKQGVESSEEKTARFGAAMAGLKPIADLVTKAIQGLADAVLWVVEQGGKVLQWLGLATDETERYTEMEKLRYDTKKRTDELIVDSAKAEAEVSELRNKAKQKEQYTDEERLAFVQQANAIEEEIAKKKVQIAEDNLKILQEETKATQNTAEIETKLKEAEAAVWREKKAYSDKTRELIEQENTIKTQIATKDKTRHAEELKRIEEKKKAQKAYNDALLAETQKAEDALNNLISDNVQKQLAIRETQYSRELEALEQKSALYQNDAAMMQELNTQKLALEMQYQNDVAAIREQASQDHIARLQQEYEQEQGERELIFQNRLDEAMLQGQDIQQIELDQAAERLAAIQEEGQQEWETDAQYKARLLDAEKQYSDKKRNMLMTQIENERAVAQSIGGVLGSVSRLMEQFGDDNEEAAKASKILALAQIAIETGVALARGIAQASAAGPWPANLPAIATTVATIIANIATAISTVKSAQFAEGGQVHGAGTGTSDSIPAMLSNGEFVINARATRKHLSLLEDINSNRFASGGLVYSQAYNATATQPNVRPYAASMLVTGGGSQGIDYETLASVMAERMSEVSIRVGVDEITDVQKRNAQLDELSKVN